MPMNFAPRERSSFDGESGISILRPRILPAATHDENGTIEYEFTFLSGSERVGWIGCLGTWKTYGTAAEFSSVYTLDLGSPGVIADMIRFKERVGNCDDMTVFFGGLARGLLNALAGQSDNTSPTRYVAVISKQELQERMITVPAEALLGDGCTVVVAEVTVPAQGS